MPVTLSVTVIRTTEKAVQVKLETGQEQWIPKSVIDEPDADELGAGEIVDIAIRSWFAKKEGLE